MPDHPQEFRQDAIITLTSWSTRKNDQRNGTYHSGCYHARAAGYMCVCVGGRYVRP